MERSASMVTELRERTGAGIMDCKRALSEQNCDLEKAVEYLREKGLASAAKKAGRVAAEGMVGSYVQPDSTNGSLVEVNCETDFVAKTDDFKAFVHELAVHITKHAPQSVSAEEEGAKAPYLVDQAFKDQQTVGEYVTQMVAKTGEFRYVDLPIIRRTKMVLSKTTTI